MATCVSMHQAVCGLSEQYFAEARRTNYVSPSHFLELLASFGTLYDAQRKEFGELRSRLESGRAKLVATAQQVVVMQNELQALQPILVETSQQVCCVWRERGRERERVRGEWRPPRKQTQGDRKIGY